jgi:hypothetical protein
MECLDQCSKSGFGSSGSTRQRYGYVSCSESGPFYLQAKIVRKTLIPLWLLLYILSLKNYVNVPSKSTVMSRNFFKVKISLLLAPWRSITKIAGSGSISPRIRMRIRIKMSWIRNTGLDAVPVCFSEFRCQKKARPSCVKLLYCMISYCN